MRTLNEKEKQYVTAMRNAQVFANMAEDDEEILDVAYGAAGRFHQLEKVWGNLDESKHFMFRMMNMMLRNCKEEEFAPAVYGVKLILKEVSEIDGREYRIYGKRIVVKIDGEWRDASTYTREKEV